MNLADISKLLGISFITVFFQSSFAANLQVKVVDNNSEPVEFAVIYINDSSKNQADNTLIIDQVDKEFIPYVTAVRRGSSINFPNNDDIRHQVYSFSKSKQFELPLYSGNEFRPVVFNESGAVALACNIHDWMKAYVYVVDTDKFVISDKDGQGVLADLSNGQYEVLVWHPTQGGNVQSSAQKITVADSDKQLTFAINPKKQFKPWRAPKSTNRRGY